MPNFARLQILLTITIAMAKMVRPTTTTAPCLLLWFTSILLLFHVGHTKEQEKYLYVKGDMIDPSFPVMEYKTTPANNNNLNNNNNNASTTTTDHPAFLFDPNYPYHRVVEFYAPWCPHCIHFRNSFVEFAGNITEFCKSLNVTIQIYAVSCMAHQKICQEFGIDSYPRVRLFSAGSVNGTEIPYWNLHPFQLLRTFGIEMKEYTLPSLPKAIDHVVEKNVKLRNDKKHEVASSVPLRHERTKEELYSDVYASFDFAMRNSIFMVNGPLSTEQQTAFERWLRLLQKSFPPSWKIQVVISALLDDFKEASESEAGLLRILAKHPPPPSKSWSDACPNGYTCGLWEMFHVMTIGVVEYNKLAIVGEDIPVTLVADTLRDYIKYYFACEVCRVHFLHEYDTCSHDRCNRLKPNGITLKEWIELPLWLFEEHNAVNVRLLHEAAEREKRTVTREEEIGVLWPSRQDCPKCWLDDQRWDEEMVYRFLRLNYWINDAESVVIQRELLAFTPKKTLYEHDNNEERDENPQVPILLPLGLVVMLIVLASFWYQKDAYLRRSGYHKKNDL